MVWDKLLPLTILLTYKDKIMYNNNEAVEVLVMKGHTVLVSLVESEVEFCTFIGTDELWCNNESIDFNAAANIFDMKDMLVIKNTLLSLMEEFFLHNAGGFLKYSPACPRRDKIYLRYLEKAGYTAIDYGENEYLITFPH